MCLCFIQITGHQLIPGLINPGLCVYPLQVGTHVSSGLEGRDLCTLFFVLLRAGVNHPEPRKYMLAFVVKDILHWKSLLRVEP